MRHVIILSTLILVLVAGKALIEDKASAGAGDANSRPHAIDATEPPADAADEPPQEEPPPEDAEPPVGAIEPPPEDSEDPADTSGPPPAEAAPLLDAAELDQLVAPIALYPDALLAQMLIASTYPLEVIEAERFLKANPNLKGDALNTELAKQDWDDSVKALAEAPEVLAMMSAELDWMQSLGDAVLAQQPDVMEAVQRLRAKAEARGKLASTEQQRIVVNEDAGRREIVIQPAQREIVYVPYYEPQDVYGPWPYPSHPPYAFAPPPPRYAPPPRYSPGAAVATGAIAFGAGYLLGRAMDDDIDWRDRHIRVHRPGYGYYNRGYRPPRHEIQRSYWRHNAQHRRGVKYKNPEVWRKYAKGNKARSAYAAPQRRSLNPSKQGLRWGQAPKVKPAPRGKYGAVNKYGGASKKAGPPKFAKPPKQFTPKPRPGHAAVAPKKPSAKYTAPKPKPAARAKAAAKPKPKAYAKPKGVAKNPMVMKGPKKPPKAVSKGKPRPPKAASAKAKGGGKKAASAKGKGGGKKAAARSRGLNW